MTALAQGSIGVALVMSFALLRSRQLQAVSLLLAVQCAAVALDAMLVDRPLLALAPVLLGAAVWLVCNRVNPVGPRTEPAGGAKPGIAAGAVLAVLCQSQGSLALPLAVILLAVVLAATRPHPVMRVIALVCLQNGLVLTSCGLVQVGILPAGGLPAEIMPADIMPAAMLSSAWLPFAGLALPLAAGLLLPPFTWHGRRAPRWLGWVDLALSIAVFAATLIVPLHAMAVIFAPLLGFDGVMRSCARRKRTGLTLAGRGLALLTSSLIVLAVCAPTLGSAWLAVLAALTTALLPVLRRRRDAALSAFLGAGFALFGLLLLTAAPFIIGYFSLFVGFAMIAAVVPDLAPALTVLLLGFANGTSWPSGAETLGIGIALTALLACALLLLDTRNRRTDTKAPASAFVVWRGHRSSLLQLSQSSIAVLSISVGQPDGRFAALVLLILLILSRSAARASGGLVGTVAVAGLGGIPPFGVFPGLVLVVLAVTNYSAWLLLPLGAAAVPIILASQPRRFAELSLRPGAPSVFWLPLVIALLAGYFAPNALVLWWHTLMAGRS